MVRFLGEQKMNRKINKGLVTVVLGSAPVNRIKYDEAKDVAKRQILNFRVCSGISHSGKNEV